MVDHYKRKLQVFGYIDSCIQEGEYSYKDLIFYTKRKFGVSNKMVEEYISDLIERGLCDEDKDGKLKDGARINKKYGAKK